MDLNYLLCWIVAILCGMSIATLVRARPPGWREAAPPAGVLAVLALGLALVPDMAGYASALVYGLLVSLPRMLEQRCARALAVHDDRRARRLAVLLVLLRPFGPARDMARAFALRDLARRSEPGVALPILRRRAGSESMAARTATALTKRLEQDWEGLRAWLEVTTTAPIGTKVDLVPPLLRFLGETGSADAMVERAIALLRDPAVGSRVVMSPPVVVPLLAFDGRITAVESVLASGLAPWPEHVKAYWRGIARWSSGDEPGGRVLIESARHAGDYLMAADVAARLARPLPPSGLSASSLAFLDNLERTVSRLPSASDANEARPIVTWALLGLCGAVFVVEVVFQFRLAPRGVGPPIDDSLVTLGALVPSLVVQGQWWRVLAAMFLHAGLLHLGMNSYGLFILGPPVERALGALRFATVYMVAGIGSMLAVVLMTWAGFIADNATVGASGAIMGLVGALAALAIRHRAPDSRQRLARIGLVVGLQVIFDFVTPQISMAGHLGGLITGFVVALVVA